MKLHNYILLLICLSSVLINSCETERHPVPNFRFSVTIDLNLPDYNRDFFTLNRDRYGRKAGISGVLIIRKSFDEYYVFERYCPYDNSDNCKVSFDDDGFTATCSCCESQFLVAISDGDVIEGPAQYPLKTYRTRLDNNLLTIYN